MRTLVSLKLALCASASLALAQAPDSATTRHQIGLTASPQLDGLFKNNRSLPLGLFYQRQLTPTKALRLRLVGQYSHRDTANYPGNFDGFFPGLREGSYTQLIQVNLYAGYEWQQPITRRLRWAYGAEVGLGLNRQLNKLIFDTYSGLLVRTTFIRTATTWQGQVRPFVALQYQVSTRIGLFAESAVLVTYHSRKDERDTSGTPPYGRAYSYDKSHAFTLRWQPVQLVSAMCAF
ncbi:hypothetical protein [Hymenobacter elongatus]|uniref:DUF2490 domain-containing protein n=1 Tax=Hymenobacter elongatus TaxID=877208 RepID=A0A4Z0PQR4_9BACT|nr:hypothetical protein [Hymenobacter elongatus]TGE19689.1 hypothetical protein E5J99_02710 [Hymenobacter elongatus]